MKYGIEVVPFGGYADPKAIVELAVAAESAGWQGLWIWDHISFPYGVADPWITLAMIAQATGTLNLVSGVAVLPRYRPQVLWRILTSLDIASRGRLILGVGSGAIQSEFASFAEVDDPRVRAGMLDEGLDLLVEMWRGETLDHRAEYYTASGIALTPQPVQKPRPRIWIGGDTNPALRRAARWDGWIIGTVDENSKITRTPEQLEAQVGYIQGHRSGGDAFDVAIDGITSGPGDTSLVREYEAAGATWYFEILFGLRGSHQEMLKRVKAGPPR